MPRARKSKAKPKFASAPVAAPKPKRTRADGRQVTTRQRLIDVTIDIVRREGAGALTTGRIANGAGIQQPGFYVHFKNVDECLRAAAAQVSKYMVDTEVRIRRERLAVVDERDRLADTIDRMKLSLRSWMGDPRFAELLGRCRNDATPLGQSCRDSIERARVALREDLWDMASQYGLRGRYLKEIELISAILLASFLATLELVASGTYKDIDAVATQLGRNNYYHVRGELRRMFKEQADQARTPG